MEQKLKLKYINMQLQIGMANWREVYLLFPKVTALLPEVERGRLIYRAKGSYKRISYAQIKKGLIKKHYWIIQEVPDWLLLAK